MITNAYYYHSNYAYDGYDAYYNNNKRIMLTLLIKINLSRLMMLIMIILRGGLCLLRLILL